MKYRVEIIIAAVIALVVGLIGWSARRDRQSRDRASDAKGAERVVIQEKRVTDSVYVVDTLRLTRTERVRVTLRDTLLRNLTDTLLVKEYVAASDSSVRACRLALTTCERRILLADSLTALVRVQLAAAQRRPRLTKDAAVVWNATERGVEAQAGVGLRLVGRVEAVAQVQHLFLPNQSPQLQFGARISF